MKTENYKDCAKSDMMNDALKHYDEAGRAINHWRSDIYEAIKAYYSESNQLESSSPRPVEDGKPYWVIEKWSSIGKMWYNDEDEIWHYKIEKASKFYDKMIIDPDFLLDHKAYCVHMDVSEGKSDMDIVAKFPEQKTIKAKLVYEKPEQEVSADAFLTLFYKVRKETCDMSERDSYDLSKVIKETFNQFHLESLREVKMPDRDDYIRYVSKNYEGVHVYYMIIAFDYVISELKRINNLK